jgi:hypothetical protein
MGWLVSIYQNRPLVWGCLASEVAGRCDFDARVVERGAAAEAGQGVGGERVGGGVAGEEGGPPTVGDGDDTGADSGAGGGAKAVQAVRRVAALAPWRKLRCVMSGVSTAMVAVLSCGISSRWTKFSGGISERWG